MGMIITQIKRLPEGKDKATWANQVRRSAQEYIDEENGEGFEVKWLNEAEFEQTWQEQENIKNTPEIKQKYLEETRKGNVLCLELDL